MTTHSLILSPHEVLAALRGELGLVVRPVSLRHVHDIEEDGTPMREGKDGIWREAKCPLGVPGDRLCCKETWAVVPYPAPGDKCRIFAGGVGITYKADWQGNPSAYRFISPVTMPAWVSRITLEVVGVRVCRLAEITEEDARATGVTGDCPIGHIPSYQKGPLTYHFSQEWESRYGKRYPWESNPWIWVAKVKRVGGGMPETPPFVSYRQFVGYLQKLQDEKAPLFVIDGAKDKARKLLGNYGGCVSSEAPLNLYDICAWCEDHLYGLGRRI